jgi:hypothetical protein
MQARFVSRLPNFVFAEQSREVCPGGNSRIILRGVWAVVTTIVFNPLLINPDNPRIILGGVWAMVTTIAFNPLLINLNNP